MSPEVKFTSRRLYELTTIGAKRLKPHEVTREDDRSTHECIPREHPQV